VLSSGTHFEYKFTVESYSPNCSGTLLRQEDQETSLGNTKRPCLFREKEARHLAE
jgi:hypothetical protein